MSSLRLASIQANRAANHTDPSPAEEAAARKKEAEEQAALPYKWTQTIGELDLTFNVPGNLKSRDLVVDIKKQSIVAGIKGQEPIISVHHSPYNPNAPNVSSLRDAFKPANQQQRRATDASSIYIYIYTYSC